MYARYWKIPQILIDTDTDMIFPKREHWASQDWKWWGTQLNKVATNNQVVVANVLKMYVKNVNKQ